MSVLVFVADRLSHLSVLALIIRYIDGPLRTTLSLCTSAVRSSFVMHILTSDLQIVDHLQELRPPLTHGGISPENVLIVKRDGKDVPQKGIWRVILTGFGEGIGYGYSVDYQAQNGGQDEFGVGVVLLFALSGKGVDEYIFKEGRPTFLRKVCLRTRLLMRVLLCVDACI